MLLAQFGYISYHRLPTITQAFYRLVVALNIFGKVPKGGPRSPLECRPSYLRPFCLAAQPSCTVAYRT